MEKFNKTIYNPVGLSGYGRPKNKHKSSIEPTERKLTGKGNKAYSLVPCFFAFWIKVGKYTTIGSTKEEVE